MFSLFIGLSGLFSLLSGISIVWVLGELPDSADLVLQDAFLSGTCNYVDANYLLKFRTMSY